MLIPFANQFLKAAETPPTEPPVPPSNLQAKTVSTSQINLHWQDNSFNEQGFKIERRIPQQISGNAIGSFEQIITVGANVISYSDTGLNSNTNYEYRVSAYNAAGDSSYSNTAGVVTYFCNPNTCNPNNNQQICNSQGTFYNTCPNNQVCSNNQCIEIVQPLPAAPSNLQATSLSPTQIRLMWQDNSFNEQGFRIEARKVQVQGGVTGSVIGFQFTEIGSANANINIFTASNLESNTQYEFRVYAFNSNGNSAYSNLASARTQASICNSLCNNGERRCFGGGYQICQDINNNGCYEWGNTIMCTQSQICFNGYCSSQQQNRCSDNTLFNQCSANKPRYCNNGMLVNNCNLCGCNNNGVCLQDGSCISQIEYERLTNPDFLNEAPKIMYIPKITLTLDKILNLDLNNYVYDINNRMIDIKFSNNQKTYNNNFVNCNLDNKQLMCTLINPGSLSINLIASNSIKETTFSINLDILNYSPGVKVPIANAGSDLTVIVGSYFVLDASSSYSEDNYLLEEGYKWYENDILLGTGKNLRLKYDRTGLHRIKLVVSDSRGLTAEDSLLVNVIEKNKCRNTNTKYFPQDTKCNYKWPSTDGVEIVINSKDYSCNLVEVCDESIDYIIEDAIDCCDGTQLTSPRKSQSCVFANKYSNSNSKRCQALYIINSLGADQVYMQDYLEAEMCCRGVEELCSSRSNLYTANPKPNTETNLDNLRCYNTPSNNPPGNWISDVELERNNIALADLPAHASLNQLSTGTCVDYSFSVTTLLRKLGLNQQDVMTVEAPNHAYNLVRLPLDKKYTVVDTTGNNEPPLVLGSVPYGYPYCENIKNCYNDNGKKLCPRLGEINGCENTKISFIKETRFKGLEISEELKSFFEFAIEEIKR